MAGLLYLDSSALVKLVLPEPESAALLAYLGTTSDRITSSIATIEVLRAARRASENPTVERRAREVLAGVHLLRMNKVTLEAAVALEPRGLRTLDAVHLAAATALAPELEAMVVYDHALAEAARATGIKVEAPAG